MFLVYNLTKEPNDSFAALELLFILSFHQIAFLKRKFSSPICFKIEDLGQQDHVEIFHRFELQQYLI